MTVLDVVAPSTKNYNVPKGGMTPDYRVNLK